MQQTIDIAKESSVQDVNTTTVTVSTKIGTASDPASATPSTLFAAVKQLLTWFTGTWTSARASKIDTIDTKIGASTSVSNLDVFGKLNTIEDDTDVIGSTADTGGSTTAGTVMGKLNKLISSTEIYGKYPVLPSEDGCILIPITTESGVSTNKSNVLGYGTFTPTLDIPVHGAIIQVDVDWTSSSGSSSNIKIIRKGASSAEIDAANTLMVYNPTSNSGPTPSAGIHYILNECVLEAGVTYEIVGFKATLSNLSVSYKLGDVSKGCEMIIYQNSDPTSTSKYLALTNTSNVQNIYLSTTGNFTVKLRFKGNSTLLKATVNGTDYPLSSSNTEEIVAVPLNASTPLTITIASSSTSSVRLYYAYLELIPAEGLAIA